MELTKLTISQAHQGLIKKEFSALELTENFLDRIKIFDKKFSSFLTLAKDLALSQAKKIDELILRGENLPLLAGIPFAIKDNILVENLRCTAGSKILENYIAPYDASCIKKLKEEGAIILGKTNLDEFAMGSSCEHSAFFPTKNPWDLARVPGGSSGGSAAAVAGNLCIFALGSDTGGSIRLPASFCGVVGLKPTYGAVSRYGLISMASSLDQIGPITKNVEDSEIVFKTIGEKDFLDSTSVQPKLKVENIRLRRRFLRQRRTNSKFEIGKIKIGIPREYFTEGMDPKIEDEIKRVIKKIEGAGAKIEEISLPHTGYALACYYIIVPSEVSANLARYDGIKYGLSIESKSLIDTYFKSRAEGLGSEVKRRIMLGTYALSAGYYEAYYLRAQKVRTKIREDFERAFEKIDFILTPTSPNLPFKLGEKIKDPLKMYLSDIFMVAVNLAGLPAISIPCGKVKNLPVGLQIIGKPFEEDKILEIGKIFEKL